MTLFLSVDIQQTVETVEKVLLLVVAILVVFDIYLYLNKTPGDTISNILRDWVYDKFFFISYLWGVLAGHFFLGAKNPPFDDNLKSLAIVLSIGLVLFLFGMFYKKFKPKPIHQVLLLLFGGFIGHFFWSLN